MSLNPPAARYFPEKQLTMEAVDVPARREYAIETLKGFAPLWIELAQISTMPVANLYFRVDRDRDRNYLDLNTGAMPGLDYRVAVIVRAYETLRTKVFKEEEYAGFRFSYGAWIHHPQKDIIPERNLLTARKMEAFYQTNISPGDYILVTLKPPENQFGVVTQIGMTRVADTRVTIRVERDGVSDFQVWYPISSPAIEYYTQVWLPFINYMEFKLSTGISLTEFGLRVGYEFYQLTDQIKQKWGL